MKLLKLSLALNIIFFLAFGGVSFANVKPVKSLKKITKVKEADLLVTYYLQIKNALVSDNGKAAATAAKKMSATFKSFDVSAYSAEDKEEISEIIENALEQAEHIAENSGKIEHQREHFEVLSNDMADLLSITGTATTLYQTRCPMYNNGKGGIWLSETKEIRNPFYGSKMLTCGSVQKQF